MVCWSEVVVGEDRETGERDVLLGREALADWEAGRRAAAPRVVTVRYDGSTAQRVYAALAVYLLKGSCGLGDVDRAIGEVMDRRPVPYADGESRTTVSIPARELVAGMVRTWADDRTGLVWTEPAGVCPAAVRWPRLGAGLRKRLRAVREAVAEVRPLTAREWEDEVRGYADPELAVAAWEHIADCYDFFTTGEPLGPDGRAEAFRVVVAASRNGAWYAARHCPASVLPRERVREIAAFVEQTWDMRDWPPAPPGRTRR